MIELIEWIHPIAIAPYSYRGGGGDFHQHFQLEYLTGFP